MTPEELREIRRGLGYTYAQMAKAVGVSKDHMRRLETLSGNRARPIMPWIERRILALKTVSVPRTRS